MVVVGYGNIRALKDISLEIVQGEIVTLIGANGAGKTTILKSISGILAPRSGRITKITPHHMAGSLTLAQLGELEEVAL